MPNKPHAPRQAANKNSKKPVSTSNVTGEDTSFIVFGNEDKPGKKCKSTSANAPVNATIKSGPDGKAKAPAGSNSEQQQQEQPVTRATPTSHTLPERPLVPTCPADWEANKDIIYDLYMNKNFILNDVVEIMLSTHRFKATYASHLWSVRRQLTDCYL